MSDPNVSVVIDGQSYSLNEAAAASAAITVPGIVPQAEYMYGCTPTAVGMILAYYDLYGYRGSDGKLYDFSALIDGVPELNARGTDGDIYNMNAFDTVLGNFIASRRHVDEFFFDDRENPMQEYQYSFVPGTTEFDTSRWDCLADYLGTNQYWRGNSDYSTTLYLDVTLEYIINSDYLYTAGMEIGKPLSFEIKWADVLYGLSMYVETTGYSMDAKNSYTFRTDNNGGSFSFEDYKREIDAGHLLLISIEGHSMVGYGYDAETNEIILDDTYEHDQRMKWGGSYYYAGEYRELLDISVIAFNTDGVALLEEEETDLEINTVLTEALTVDSRRVTVTGTGGFLIGSQDVPAADAFVLQLTNSTPLQISGQIHFYTGAPSAAAIENVSDAKFTVSLKDSSLFELTAVSGAMYGIYSKGALELISFEPPAEMAVSGTSAYGFFTEDSFTSGAIAGSLQVLSTGADGAAVGIQAAKGIGIGGIRGSIVVMAEGGSELSALNASAIRITDLSGRIVGNRTDGTVSVGALLNATEQIDVSVSGILFSGAYAVAGKSLSDSTKLLLAELDRYYADASVTVSSGILSAVEGRTVIRGGSGNDTVRLNSGALVMGDIDLGSGNDQLTVNAGARIFGGVFSDSALNLTFDIDRLYDHAPISLSSSAFADGRNPAFADSSTSMTLNISGSVSGTQTLIERKLGGSESGNAGLSVLNGKVVAVRYLGSDYTLRIGEEILSVGESVFALSVQQTGEKENLVLSVLDKDAPVPEILDSEASLLNGNVSVSVWGINLIGFDVRFSETGDFSGSEVIAVRGSLGYSAAMSAGTYYYQVRGIGWNNMKGDWSSAGTFTSVVDAPDRPKDHTPLTLNAAHVEEIGGSDRYDYFRIDLSAGLYGVTLNTAAKVKVSLMNGNKTVASATAKNGVAYLKPRVLEANTYYLLVEDKQGKNSTSSAYSLTVGGSAFPDADLTDNAPETTQAVLALGDVRTAWAGFGDDKNYASLALDYAGSYNFSLTAKESAPLKLTVYQNGKKLKSATFKNGTGSISSLLIDNAKGSCYVEVAATGAKKGIGTDYDLAFSGTAYSQADNSDDSWSPSAVLPQLAFGGTASDWVGFGDTVDYKELELSAPGSYSVSVLSSSNPVRLTLYQEAGGKLKKIASSTGASIQNQLLDPANGRCFIAVEARDWKKGKDAFYEIQLSGTRYAEGCNMDDRIADVRDNALPVVMVAGAETVLNDWVGFGDTVDYFAFRMEESSNVKLSLSSAAGKALKLSLFDSGEHKVALNADGVSKTVLNAGEVYYAGVTLSNYRKNPDNSYSLGIAAV